MRMPKTASKWRWWPLLLLTPLGAYGQETVERAVQPGQAPEFLDFLEYLGSWDGAEQDWVQFLDEDETTPHRDAGEEPAELEDLNDVVS
jgi:hypothetical protein